MENTAIYTAIATARTKALAALNNIFLQANSTSQKDDVCPSYAFLKATHELEHGYVTWQELVSASQSSIVVPKYMQLAQDRLYPVAKGDSVTLNRRGLDALLVWCARIELDIYTVKCVLAAEEAMSATDHLGTVRIEFLNSRQRERFFNANRLMVTAANQPYDITSSYSFEFCSGRMSALAKRG